MAIKNHSVTPKTSGLTPTDLMVDLDNPAPIKKSVNVKLCRETDTISCVIDFGIFTYVFRTMASMKNKINHGMVILSPFDLK